ncbi:unnamed protein product [Pedinophyceae sp. YPF-701]|nr:unnamed protein product [Pedinophyceae sp. YPF-701]
MGQPAEVTVMELPSAHTMLTTLGLATLSPRSLQWDALRLDSELVSMLKDQLGRAVAYAGRGLAMRLQPELDALLRLAVLRLSLGKGNSTPGAALLGMELRTVAGTAQQSAPAPDAPAPESGKSGASMSPQEGVPGGGSASRAASAAAAPAPDASSNVERPEALDAARPDGASPGWGVPLSRSRKVMYAVLTVGVRYGWARLEDLLTRHGFPEAPAGSWKAGVWRTLRWLERAVRVLSAVNFIAFLYEGRYPTLETRLLRARLMPTRIGAPRAITFQFLNRQLVWEELSALVLAILPLIDPAAISRGFHVAMGAIRASLRRTRTIAAPPEGSGDAEQAGAAQADEERPINPHSQCPECGLMDVTGLLAVAEPCGHVHCYYCLRGACETDPKHECRACGTRIEHIAV